MDGKDSNKRKIYECDSEESDPEVSFKFVSEKKKRKTAPKMSTDSEPAFVAQILNKLDEKADAINNNLSLQLAPLREQVNNNSASIVAINKTLARLEKDQKEAKFAVFLAAKPSTAAAAAKEEKYLISRRSGRFWPIPGTTPDELRSAAVEMIQGALLVPDSEKIADRIENVRRTRTSFTSKIADEAIVIFDSAATRDLVFSHAKNLAKIAPPAKRESLGLRLDYPAHLGSDYRALDAYGAQLRAKCEKGFRRNIRFNDDEQNLVMDINFPNQTKWIRVSAKMAKEERVLTTVDDEEEARKLIKLGLDSQTGPSALTGANSVPVGNGQNQNRQESWRNPTHNNLGEEMDP